MRESKGKITKDIDKLVYISRFYGNDTDIVQAGGGNTSVKNDTSMWIKLSGVRLKNIKDKNNFMKVELNRIKPLLYDETFLALSDCQRNKVIKNNIFSTRNGNRQKRYSIEIFLHAAMEEKFIMHTHPVYINAMACSLQGKEIASVLFKEFEYLWIPYRKPGFLLGQAMFAARLKYRRKFKIMPNIVFLQNHGLIISGSSIDDIKILTEMVMSLLRGFFGDYKKENPLPPKKNVSKKLILNLYKVISSKFPERYFELLISKCPYVHSLSLDSRLSELALKGALYPDHVVYCGIRPLILDQKDDEPAMEEKLSEFMGKKRFLPKYAVIPRSGVCIIGANNTELNNIEEMLNAHVKTLILLLRKGQPVFLANKECEYLAQWEAEKYRQKAAQLS